MFKSWNTAEGNILPSMGRTYNEQLSVSKEWRVQAMQHGSEEKTCHVLCPY